MQILDATGATWGNWYWPAGLIAILAWFLPAEIYGLVNNSANTLSAWVWRSLKIARDMSMLEWSATDFLVFGAWLTLVVWLTGHFFFGRFT
jgi:hypothetical protein